MTYLDNLNAEPDRLRKSITRLVEDQQTYVNRLQALLDDYVFKLDVAVLRFSMLRVRFGAGHGETMEAERQTEDASKPVTELRGVVNRQREILEQFEGYFDEFERTGAIASLAAAAPEAPTGGA